MVKRIIKRFVNWFKGFFEHKGEQSSKRATVFAFVLLFVYLNIEYAKTVKDAEWRYWQMVLVDLSILLILGVATIEAVITFFRILRNKPDKQENADDTKKEAAE